MSSLKPKPEYKHARDLNKIIQDIYNGNYRISDQELNAMTQASIVDTIKVIKNIMNSSIEINDNDYAILKESLWQLEKRNIIS